MPEFPAAGCTNKPLNFPDDSRDSTSVHYQDLIALTPSADEIVAAAHAAGAHTFITAFAHGYNSSVGRGGCLLTRSNAITLRLHVPSFETRRY